ncbi:hypothetical protein ACI2U6_17360 [Ralstonia nicotianae]
MLQHELRATAVSNVEPLPRRVGDKKKNAATGGDESSERAPKFASWKVIAPFVGAVTAYAAYLVGVAFHETYLGSFGVSPGAFPKGHSDYLVYAVEAVLKDLGAVLSGIMTLKAMLSVVGVLLAIGCICWLLVELAIAADKRYRGPRHFSLSPRVKLIAVYLFALPLGGAYLLFAIPTVFASVMILPVQLGVAAAKAMAADDKADFKKGCAAHARGKHCFVLREGKEIVATGFIIEQSKDTVAIWDSGVVQVHPMEKRSLISVDAVL